MNEEDQSGGMSYAGLILSKWQEVMDASEEFHNELLLHNGTDDREEEYDSEVGRVYIVKMCRLWTELRPKVATPGGKPRKDFDDIYEEYLAFKPFVSDPSKFTTAGEDGKIPQDSGDKLFKLEETLRDVIERLKITEF